MLSVVIPLYNEAASAEELHKRLNKVMQGLSCDYEIIYVNDGSSDTTLKILKSLPDQYSSVKIISFDNNQGQSAALLTGFTAAKGEWIITLDGDLQNPPEEIPKLLKFKDKGSCISGVRYDREDSFLKKISSIIARFFRWFILGDITKDTGCSLRMFRKEILKQLPLFNHFHRFFIFLVRLAGYRVIEIAVGHKARKFGKSKYGILKRAREGIFDLIGVYWLKKRFLHYRDG